VKQGSLFNFFLVNKFVNEDENILNSSRGDIDFYASGKHIFIYVYIHIYMCNIYVHSLAEWPTQDRC
jgi:hypothetical protein